MCASWQENTRYKLEKTALLMLVQVTKVVEVVIIGALPVVVVSRVHEGTAEEEEEEAEAVAHLEPTDTIASLISRVPMHASIKKGSKKNLNTN